MAQEDIEREQEAWRLLDAFIETRHEELASICRQGDGECGAISERFKQAFATETNSQPMGSRRKKPEIPAWLRTAVFERDAYRCVECGGWKSLCCDHVYPESKGGKTSLNNLQTMCRSCNSSKGTHVPAI